MIYLYGLAAADCEHVASRLDGMTGLQAPLQQTQIGDWTLVHSDHDDQEILPKRRLLLAHTTVLEQMVSMGTVLPARFGLVANDIAEVTTLIHAMQEKIATEFDKVRGAIELGIRVSFPRQAALAATLQGNPRLHAERAALQKKGPQAHFEIAEFGGKLADHLDRRRAQAQRRLLDALLPMARDHVLRKPEEDTEVLRAEFLVDEQMQTAFETMVTTAASDLDFAPGEEASIQVIGPVPMYNFVRLNLTFDVDQAAA